MTVISVRTELIDWYRRHGYVDTGERKPFIADDLPDGICKNWSLLYWKEDLTGFPYFRQNLPLMDLHQLFEQAVADSKTLSEKPSNDTLLQLYSFLNREVKVM